MDYLIASGRPENQLHHRGHIPACDRLRGVKAGILVVAAVCCAHGQTLRTLADERGIRIGTAVAPFHLSEREYATVLSREFNQVEPENALKFGPVHPERDRYNFSQADALVEFAQAHGMAVRGHTLVWHNQVARWVTEGNFTPEERAEISHQHIQTVVGRYAGKVYAWDVVNEAWMSDGSLRKSVWNDGPGYIERAFRWAHEADPKALLFYNDYDAEGMNAKSEAIYNMAKDFKARGVPLDGVGMQMHIGLKPLAVDQIERNMRRLVNLGLQVQITELDVALPIENGVASAESIAAQAQRYREVVGLCVKVKGCTAIQTWGFTDKYSWIPGFKKGFGAALEFDAQYQPKPAYQAMIDALKR